MTLERFGLKVTHVEGDWYIVENFGRRKRMRIFTKFPPQHADDLLWVERGEDYYALDSPQLKNRNVIVVDRSAFMNAPYAE